MQATLLIAVAWTTVALCSAADPECKYRRIRSLPPHWANPTDCTRYFRCTPKNVMREIVCTDGKVYNANTGRCATNEQGLCKLTLLAPLIESLNPCDDEVSGAYLPQTGYCRNFYICNDNKAYPQACEAGSLFNATTANCQPDTASECWQNKCINETDGTYLSDAASCNSFYVCAYGAATAQNCGSGSYFNSTRAICEPDATGQYCWENLCVERSDGDFVKDASDCYSYYVCAGRSPIKQTCPNGSYFNSLENSCVPGVCPIETTTEQVPDSTTDSTQDTSTDCTQETTTQCIEITTDCGCPGGYTNGETAAFPGHCDKYYVCANGQLQVRACGEDYRFDSSLGSCVPDTEHTCWTTECPPVTTTACAEFSTTTECSAVGSCPGGYKNGELLPFPNYPENCDKYYECSDGRLLEKECGKGNRFDCSLGACVPDTEHICAPAECNEQDGSARKRRSVNANTWSSSNCLGVYGEGAVIRHPKDCRKYLVCVSGEMVSKDCGAGKYFELISLQCIEDTQQICGTNGRYNKGTAPLLEKSVDPSMDIESTECPQVTTPADCNCPGGYKEGELLPLPNYSQNCNKYYICTEGRLEERECGNGNRFDGGLGVCVPDTDNTCHPTVNTECPEVSTSSPVTDCTCPGGYTDGELLPFPNYPQNCDKYYICTNGRLEERECGIGNRFDSTIGVCVPDTNNICWPNVCNGQADGTTVADSVNCTSFYLCKGGKGQIYECPADKWFDPLHQVCMPDYNATCINPCQGTTGILFLPNPDCSKYFLCNDGKPFVTTCLTGGFDVNLGKCSENAVCEATLCVGKEDGTTFPVVGNDTMFYLCLGGAAQINECTGGHVYNAALGVCLEQPSSNCDQSKCKSSVPEDGAFAPLTNADDTAFCLCRNGAAFLYHCTDNYTFRADLGICYSNAPCDPEICDVYPENTRSQNRNDTHSFCLCVSKVQVIVECPNNQTYNPASQLCQSPDDKCSSTLCLSAPDYSIFPALNNETSGFCMCLNSDPVYKSCDSGTQFDVNKNICLATRTNVCSSELCVGNSGLIVGITGDPYSFCYCINDGIAIKRSCPNSEIFNKTLMICQAVGCDGQVCLTNPNEAFPADNEPYSFCICGSREPSSVTKYTCQNGTRFDPYYRICKQDPCEKSVCVDMSNDGRAYATNNNPQDFCVCANSIPVLHSCPTGSLFNSTTGICASATNSQCDLSSCVNASSENTYALPANRDPYGFCYCFSKTVVEFFSCPDEALYDPIREICNVSMPQIPNTPGGACTCPGGYTEGQLLPNPTNCRLYYICCNGNLKEFDCGAGNSFDKLTLTCQPLGRSLEIDDTQLMRSEPIPQDSEFCVEKEKRAVTSNCSQYEICIDSIWIRLSCPNAWYYNAEQSKCMEPLDDTVCVYARVKTLPLCLATMEESTMPGQTTSCAQYYRCSHGKWHLEACSKRHFYSKRFNACIPSLEDDLCAARNDTERDEDITNSVVTQCQHMAVRPHPHDCGMYIMCLEGRWWYQYCTLGMYFNSTYNYCVPNTDGKCAVASHVTQPCNSAGSTRPTLLACNRYYECRAGYWQLRNCDSAQYFNATEQICLPDTDGVCAVPHYINCAEDERREFPLNCTAYQICIRGAWQRANCSPLWTFDNLLQRCVPNNGVCAHNGLREVCTSGDTRAHPMPESCTQFYYCLNESWTIVNCLRGHFYHKTLGECVLHAEHDKCQPQGSKLGMQQGIAINKSALCVGREDGSVVPHPGNCLHFFVCIAEVATNEQKCVRGSYFDAELGYCLPNHGKCVVPLSGVCANATDGGNVPHPHDCKAYYHCSTLNGTELAYCADGHYFRNSTNECHIDNGECRSKVNASGKCADHWEHGKLIPHERYCNIYYACVRGLAIPVACPAEHQFNVAVGHCVFNAKPQCENGTLSEAINRTTSIDNCANLTDGTYLPVIIDCTKYSVCVSGSELIKSCPTDTFFDAEQLLCLPDDGSCPYVVKSEQPLDPKICEGKHGSLLANLNNCNEFYVCINGKLHQERCFDNQYFDSTKNQCQSIISGKADLNVTETYLEKVPETKSIPYRQCNDKPTNFTQLCVRIPEGTSIAEQGDCRRYISCNEIGEPVSQRCRNGESFDSLLGVCRQNDGTCLLENGQRVGECNGRHGELVRNAENCRGYFVCINGQKISRECGENELFDKNLGACHEDVNNVCGTSTAQSTQLQMVSCTGLNNSTLYPYTPDNCRSYFQCINASAIVHKCADGLYFNATLASCVSEITECSMPAATLKRVPELPQLKVNICENAKKGQRYANISDNCRSFYICEEDGNVVSTNCPTGERYSSESCVCEISENVVCPNQPAKM